MNLRRRVFEILESAEEGDRVSKAFDIALLLLILANVLSAILETVPSLAEAYAPQFALFERVSVLLFTGEYLLRFWSIAEKRDWPRGIRGRLRFMVTPLALIDLAAIAPFYLPTSLGLDLRVIRVLRVFRILRLFKLARYAAALRLLTSVISEKWEELVLACTFALLLLLIASTLLYFVEHQAQPEAFSSIPAAMWWAVCTLTTVGYGDILPQTTLGRTLGAIISMLGVGLFALPAGILAAGFTERMRQSRARCPHCGESLESHSSDGN